MATYLLTWNPKGWNWTDLEERSDEVRKEGVTQMRWSTGVTQRIVKGDRYFLMCLGAKSKRPKGIIASGSFCSGTFWDRHWNGEKDRFCLYAQVEFDVLVLPESKDILALDVFRSYAVESLCQAGLTPSSNQELPDWKRA